MWNAGAVGRAVCFGCAFLFFTANVASAQTQYSVVDLGTLGDSFTQASAINTVGQIAGASNAPSPTGPIGHAFLWTAGVMQDLDPGSAAGSGANALNRSGQVVGGGFSGFPLRPILWSNGGRTDLGTLAGDGQGIATGINDSGQVAGYSYNVITFPSGTFVVGHAFVWTSATGLQALSPLPGQSPAHTITATFGINNRADCRAVSVAGSNCRKSGGLVDGRSSTRLGNSSYIHR